MFITFFNIKLQTSDPSPSDSPGGQGQGNCNGFTGCGAVGIAQGGGQSIVHCTYGLSMHEVIQLSPQQGGTPHGKQAIVLGGNKKF